MKKWILNTASFGLKTYLFCRYGTNWTPFLNNMHANMPGGSRYGKMPDNTYPSSDNHSKLRRSQTSPEYQNTIKQTLMSMGYEIPRVGETVVNYANKRDRKSTRALRRIQIPLYVLLREKKYNHFDIWS